MAYPYYAPYARPMGYYNPSIPQDNPNMQSGQQFQQMPVQQQQQMMQTPIQQIPMVQQMPTVQPSDDRIWVQGEAGAKAYFVAANATVVLWDTESPTLYIKSADATGKPLEMDIIDLSRRAKNIPATPQNSPIEHKCTCGDNFVLKKDFEALESEISDLREELNEIKSKPKTKSMKKPIEEAENE
jgi:hypothetical protein